MQKEAEKLAQDDAALKEEANLRKTLAEEFTSVKSGLKDGEDLSNEQLIAIMAEAVGASSEAQGNLILNKVNTMMKESNVEIEKTQKLLIELAAGVSMERARGSNPDFDDYRNDVAEIMSKTRGLSPEQAFMLAKATRSSKQPDQRQIETERPGQAPTQTSSSSRDEYTRERHDDAPPRNPKTVFKDAVSAAIDKTVAARQG